MVTKKPRGISDIEAIAAAIELVGRVDPTVSNAVRRLAEGLALRPRRTLGHTAADGTLWFEERIGSSWIAAYRLMPHPLSGRPQIAEIRLFPFEGRRPGPGLWSGSLNGMNAVAPPTGADSDVLRSVSTWRPLDSLPRRLGEAGLRHPGTAELFADVAGFGPAIWKRPGRAGRSDEDYAWIASLYVQALGSPHPLVDVARQLTEKTGERQLTEKTGERWVSQRVRDALREARWRGLLTRPGQGKAGGHLTKKARDLLAKPAGGRKG